MDIEATTDEEKKFTSKQWVERLRGKHIITADNFSGKDKQKPRHRKNFAEHL